VGEEHHGLGAGGFFRASAATLAVNLALSDELANETIYLFADWFQGLQAVSLGELPHRQAQEFRFFRKEFMAHYRKEQG
jgi:hypothetical protein